jgi:hypothetical protein
LIVAGISFVLLVIAFGLLLTMLTLSRQAGFLPDDVEALFSPKRYQPLERLLDPADESFLAAHPYCSRQLKRKFRKGRIRVFRSYVRELASDFKRICAAIKLVMIASSVDRSDLVRILIKEQVRFTGLVIYVEFKLVLYGLGVGRVDASVLLQCVDTMRAQLRSLAPLAQSTPA